MSRFYYKFRWCFAPFSSIFVLFCIWYVLSATFLSSLCYFIPYLQSWSNLKYHRQCGDSKISVPVENVTPRLKINAYKTSLSIAIQRESKSKEIQP